MSLVRCGAREGSLGAGQPWLPAHRCDVPAGRLQSCHAIAGSSLAAARRAALVPSSVPAAVPRTTARRLQPRRRHAHPAPGPGSGGCRLEGGARKGQQPEEAGRHLPTCMACRRSSRSRTVAQLLRRKCPGSVPKCTCVRLMRRSSPLSCVYNPARCCVVLSLAR